MAKKIVLSKPLTLESQSDSDKNYEASNILQRILSLFKNVRRGSELSCFKLPPVFNMPKSQLQCYAESVYCTSLDLLKNINSGKTALDRLISVAAWNISTTRPPRFGVAPYNPTLGETHHVSKYNLNVLLEQISHHPPVSALHATDDKENIEMIWCHFPVPKFTGTSVETKVHGKRQLKLHNHGETYEMNSPNLIIRILPLPGTDWVGNVSIRCLETGLVAELSYISQSFFGFGGNRRLIKGKIFDSLSMKILCKIEGHWDSTVTVKNTTNAEEERVIYDAKQVISGLQAPVVKDPESVWPTETALVWGELSQAIMSKDWEKAKEVKKNVEERQRELQRERESKGETWVPKHFTVSYSKEEGWNCSPIRKRVPNSPIVAL
ncbi:oxysterol-binding protein-related protein 4B-like [Abrus precatorius]|uniref:Oxysterol-binding protein-related protein 4B-like n=1 Tax=Abrus precatorius TaxID=3816 RepID=A0A8B8JN36_ABRPR|nr:oxysterol-binding protein-related protein 4B-like [Abrus precatorius]